MVVFRVDHDFMSWRCMVRWEGDRTGRDSPGWGSSILCEVVEWRLVRGGKWSVSDGGPGGSWTLKNSWISQFKSVVSFRYSCLSWRMWGRVHVSGSYTFWFGNNNFCSDEDTEPKKSRNRETMTTLEEIWTMTLGVKTVTTHTMRNLEYCCR